MTNQSFHTFECQMYVSRRNQMVYDLPLESGPTKVAQLEPLEYEELIAPEFRRLLAAFESVPKPLQIVQV